ncbi:hypothetical protein GQ53DRAFT_875619 [Thozetella sp. PMI_491]|nr:hypothetical protein GQ53DRAFT_875619 [Thozetella sp. PMI_491]
MLFSLAAAALLPVLAAASKRGLAWPTTNVDNPSVFDSSRISWLYNWSPNATPNSPQEFIPMQWNENDIGSLAAKAAKTTSRTVLVFNEPERGDQANMTPEHAADLWMQWIEPLRKSGIRCGSPGISSAPEGPAWLIKFLSLIHARGGDVDFYAFHWYGETLGQFYDYIWSAYYQIGATKPVWITEFASTNWDDNNPLPQDHLEDFVRQSVQYLDTLDWVERYAWFGAMRDVGHVGRNAALLDGNGQLTNLGKIYRDS